MTAPLAEVGARVRLISCDDPWTRLTPGTEGTVVFVDALGTVHVDWDDGSSLGLIPAAGDWFELLDEPTRAPHDPAPVPHDWTFVATAPNGDLYRCARPGCKADPETAEPGDSCTGYNPADD